MFAPTGRNIGRRVRGNPPFLCISTSALHRPCRRSRVGHFFQSYWTKELSIGKSQNGNSGQFGSGVGPWRKRNRNYPRPLEMLDFQPVFPCFGNDEVGSSILPSSTSLSAGKSKTYCRSAFRRGTFGPGPCAYLTFRSGDAPAIQLSFHKQPFCENGMRMTTRPTANIIFVVDHHDTKQEL